jgi:FPC/CPF motif-containing protein YcgG
MLPPSDDSLHPLADQFRAFVGDASFPCVGAKSALKRNQLKIVVANDIASAWDDLRIYPNLLALAHSYQAEPKLFQSLAVIFENGALLTEKAFERHLWERLQSLSEKDEWHGQKYDPRVSDDPDDAGFSMSFGGEAFFVVGLHPAASRPARRFMRPTLVFNLHDQFEQLRSAGLYERLRGTIIDRDIALAGSVNPMLATHGTASAAPQYSGRLVGSGWKCPYDRDRRNDIAAAAAE